MSIGQQVRELDKERREYQRSVTSEWDRTYYFPKLKDLQSRCTHNFKFTDLTWRNKAWFNCTFCGMIKIED